LHITVYRLSVGLRCLGSRRRFWSSFFLSSSDDHRVLHSFPTRRSSDLPMSSKRSMPSIGATATSGGPGISHWDIPPMFAATRVRSEEHTSELQSLAYLVCRLLLEKKN